MADTKIFFITGLPKSGTTWTVNMLNSLDGVVVRGEGCFFSNIYRNAPSLHDSLKRGIAPWFDYISHRKANWLQTDDIIETVNKYNYIRSERLEEAFEARAGDMTRAVVTGLMESAARSPGARLVGDKTPVMAPEDLLALRRVFPDAPVICMKRGVKDYVVSHLFHYHRSMRDRRPDSDFMHLEVDDFLRVERFNDGLEEELVSLETAKKLARCWASVYKAAEKLAEKTPDTFRVVSYEGLLEDPVGELTAITALLGLEEPSGRLEEAVRATDRRAVKTAGTAVMKEHVRSGEPGDWKNYLSEKASRAIDEAAGA